LLPNIEADAGLNSPFSHHRFGRLAVLRDGPDYQRLTRSGVAGGERPSILKSHSMLTAEDNEEIRRIVTQAVAESGSRVDGIVEITARAIEVLGAKEKALRWLKAPVRSLGGRTPLSLLDKPGGFARVEDALAGVY
jgi:uncharacterized protein (DUF2384 family)